jgi:poly-beta-hydroxyalkanoate depolymerase
MQCCLAFRAGWGGVFSGRKWESRIFPVVKKVMLVSD